MSESTPLDIRELRRRLSLSQAQLAQRLGVSFVTVEEIANGGDRPGGRDTLTAARGARRGARGEHSSWET